TPRALPSSPTRRSSDLRPRKPRDKAKVEAGVLVVERWILARLRHHRFFSLGELNQAIAALLDELNTRAFKKLDGCRRSRFLALRSEEHTSELQSRENLV